ncbi:CAP domain-containing protein [Acetanaerobacterium elongatum]|uniref:Uncharacterized conserved protein YkwD, contains CAP (CSP/antigen 5/PR1) domain n=1 Tax=Acetanaerobacterium elongatum TaxID=258515 RepID=A0A1H0G1W1_9FIRM|nr:CAP domain-containing protein [Acetanaerobacterium elongatum]SDO00824.1 Uncharacterized conserved protein YkwD, contains CAP (CSP/antigen 5/PR1) domain [Acetanaerobacterium elongatum]
MKHPFQYSTITLLLVAACITLSSCTQRNTQDVTASVAAVSSESSSAIAASKASSSTISPGASAAKNSEHQKVAVSSQASSVSSAASSKVVSSQAASSKASGKAVSSKPRAESLEPPSFSSESASSLKPVGSAQDYGPRLSDDTSRVPSSSFYSDVADEILNQLNDLRTSQGLNPLTKSSSLTKGAKIRAKEMFDYQYFAHTRPDGSSWETLFYTDVPLSDCEYIGENLVEYEDIYPDASAIMEMWLNSPTHYANMVRADYTHVGIAVFYGEFEDGRQLLYAVQEFGTFN